MQFVSVLTSVGATTLGPAAGVNSYGFTSVNVYPLQERDPHVVRQH